MRTTLELDDRLHEIARERAFRERRSIGDIISELALKGLSVGAAGPTAHRPLGSLAGKIWIAEDFDETPIEIREALDQPL